MRSATLVAVAGAVTAFALIGVSQAETLYSEDFFLGDTGAWGHDTDCPLSTAPGHSAPDVLLLGNTSCEGFIPRGVASTPQIATASDCGLSFNYLLDYTETVGVSFEVSVNDQVLVSTSDDTLANDATWTAIEGLDLPAGGVVIDFIGDYPASTSGAYTPSGNGFLIDDVAVDCPGDAEPAYSEDFFLMHIDNGASPISGWMYNTSCAASQQPGHSTPGVLRWGPSGCNDYFPGGQAVASTPSISTTGECSLSFNYLLDCCFETQSGHDPSVNHCGSCPQVTIDVSANGNVLTSLVLGDATWRTVDGLQLPPGEVVIDFAADASTAQDDSNGPGLFIDDIAVNCQTAVPVDSEWSAAVMMLALGIGLAIVITLSRAPRRRLSR